MKAPLSFALAAAVSATAFADRFAGFSPRIGTHLPSDPPQWWNFDVANRAESQDAHWRIYEPARLATTDAAFAFVTPPDFATGAGGTTATSYQQAMLRWTNLNRYMSNDVPIFASWDASLVPSVQAGAFLLARNPDYNGFLHRVPETLPGWNPLAAEGLLRSNVVTFGHGLVALDAFLDDGGTGNQNVGHRALLLAPFVGLASGDVFGLPSPSRAANNIRLSSARPYPISGDPADFLETWPARGYVAHKWTGAQNGGLAGVRVSLAFQHAASANYDNATFELWVNDTPRPVYEWDRITPFSELGLDGVSAYVLARLNGNAPNARIVLQTAWRDLQGPPPADVVFRFRVSGVVFSPPGGVNPAAFPGVYGVPRTFEWTTTVYDENKVAPAPFVSASPVANLSTRAVIGQGEAALIGGFVVEGTDPLRVVIRALGPTLTQYGIPGVASNPHVALYRSLSGATAEIGQVANWQDEGSWRMVQSYGLAPSNPGEVAFVATLPPGAYTSVTTDATGGVGLVEIYAADTFSRSRLVNVATRGHVGGGANVMIAGFVLKEPRSVVVRVRGPELAAYGVVGTLDNPRLSVFRGNEMIAENDDWNVPENARLNTDLSFYRPLDPREPARVLTLPAGAYTVVVDGVADSTGVALVEVYDVP